MKKIHRRGSSAVASAVAVIASTVMAAGVAGGVPANNDVSKSVTAAAGRISW